MTTAPRIRFVVSKRHPPHHSRVTIIQILAYSGKRILGGAIGEVGTVDALISWKQDAGGGGWAAPEWDTLDEAADSEKIGYFSGVEVSDEARGRGIGRKLAAKLVEAMHDAGAVIQWLVVVPLDRDTEHEGLHRLYRSLGFTEMPSGDENALWRVTDERT